MITVGVYESRDEWNIFIFDLEIILLILENPQNKEALKQTADDQFPLPWHFVILCVKLKEI